MTKRERYLRMTLRRWDKSRYSCSQVRLAIRARRRIRTALRRAQKHEGRLRIQEQLES